MAPQCDFLSRIGPTQLSPVAQSADLQPTEIQRAAKIPGISMVSNNAMRRGDFEPAIKMKIARMFGLEISNSVLVQATEVMD